MVTAAYIAGTFVVLGVSGFYLWRRQHLDFARAGFSIAMWLALVLVPLQIVLGDAHGRNTLDYQPIKVAAMEGDWETRRGSAPDRSSPGPMWRQERNDYEVEIPHLGSLILTHAWNGEVEGLKAAPPADRPYVPFVFFAFRIMVGIGVRAARRSRWPALVCAGAGGSTTRAGSASLCAFSSPLPLRRHPAPAGR